MERAARRAPRLPRGRSGHIITSSSTLGLTAFPGWGLYSAGKFAVEGLTESLAAEVADMGIDVTLIEPGYMRTDFLKPQSLGVAGTTVAAHPAVREMTAAHQAMPGTQLGDPVKAATAIITVATTGAPALHQVLGSDSLSLAEGRLASLGGDLEAGRELALTTDIVAEGLSA